MNGNTLRVGIIGFGFARTTFHADSTDSDPPDVKNTRFRSPGVSDAIRSASSIARGCA